MHAARCDAVSNQARWAHTLVSVGCIESTIPVQAYCVPVACCRAHGALVHVDLVTRGADDIRRVVGCLANTVADLQDRAYE